MTPPEKSEKDENLNYLPAKAEIKARIRAQELGMIGKFFGSRENATFYVAALFVLLAGASVLVLAVYEPTYREDAFKGFLAFVFVGLGYFGRSLTH